LTARFTPRFRVDSWAVNPRPDGTEPNWGPENDNVEEMLEAPEALLADRDVLAAKQPFQRGRGDRPGAIGGLGAAFQDARGIRGQPAAASRERGERAQRRDVAVPGGRSALPPCRRGERVEGRAVERFECQGAVLGGKPVDRLRVGTPGRVGHVALQERLGCVGDGLAWV